MSDWIYMKIKNKYEQNICTETNMVVEHEGKDYRWSAWVTENSSGEDWFLDGKIIVTPKWAEDIDMWDRYELLEVGDDL